MLLQERFGKRVVEMGSHDQFNEDVYGMNITIIAADADACKEGVSFAQPWNQLSCGEYAAAGHLL